MNRKLLVAVVSGALVLPMTAQVNADATVYGSLRYGVQMADADGASTDWQLGNNKGSRFGIKGEAEAGEGLTAGFKIERTLGDSLNKRHEHVYLSGGFGKITLGQQDAPYYGATTWDGAPFLGGGTDFIFRTQGVSYASALGGPFNFSILVGNEGEAGKERGDGADHIEVTGKLAAGPVSFSAGYMEMVDESERIGGTVGGAMAGIDWTLGYESASDACGASCDADRYGLHVGYAIGGGGVGGGNAFVQFGERDGDMDTDDDVGDMEYWLVGYSHFISDNVTASIVYNSQDKTMMSGDMMKMDKTTNDMVLVLKVDF